MASRSLVIAFWICFNLWIVDCSDILVEPESNQYDTDNKSYWRSLSQFKPELGKSFGVIQLRQSMEMEFKVICHSVKHDHPNNDYENIFRIGTNGLDYGCNTHGARYPAVYIDTKGMKFEFAISDRGSCWEQYPRKAPCPHCLDVELGAIYHFAMRFNESNVHIEYDLYNKRKQLVKSDVIFHGKRRSTSILSHLCRYQDVIISDPLNVAADVTLWDIDIRSSDTNLYCRQWEKYQQMHRDL